MITLDGILEVDKIINEFLEPFGVTARLGLDFGYYEDEEIITYALIIAEGQFDNFLDSVEAQRPEIELDVFVWGLLHELGHHITLPTFSKAQRARINEKHRQVDEDEIDALEYYKIADEVAATRWAVEFAETNAENVKEFWEKLQGAIMDFYKLNGITNDDGESGGA